MSESSINSLDTFVLGSGIVLFILFLGIVWWVLSIILFFKVWRMTNNIQRMKDIAEEQLELEHPFIDDSVETKNEVSK